MEVDNIESQYWDLLIDSYDESIDAKKVFSKLGLFIAKNFGKLQELGYLQSTLK